MDQDQVNQKTIVFNSLGRFVPRLDLYELSVPWGSREGFYAIGIIMIMVLLSDHSQIPLTLKIWVLFVIWFIRLIWEDVQLSIRGKKLVVIPLPLSSSFSTSLSSSSSSASKLNLESVQYEALERTSLLECDVHMTTVKILEEDDLAAYLSSSPSFAMPLSTSTRRKSTNEFPSRLLFRIEMSTTVKRWYIWKRYEDVLDVYQHLVLLHGKDQIPRLKSFPTLAKTYYKDTTAGKIATMTSIVTLDQPFAYSQLHQDSCFLQYATETLIQWFVQVQQLSHIRDDVTVRAFLALPPLSVTLLRKTPSAKINYPMSPSASSPFNSSSNALPKSTHTVYPLTMDAVAEVPDSLLLLSSSRPTSLKTGSATSTETSSSAVSRENGSATDSVSDNSAVSTGDFSLPSLLKPTTSLSSSHSMRIGSETSVSSSSAINGANKTESDENPNTKIHTYYLEDGECTIKWRGTTIDTFEFLDFPEPIRLMVADKRFSHGFKVRGVSYMTDKKKIEADPAIGRFLWYDVFPVDVELFGDRHDHAAAIFPMAQHRIRIIQSLVDKPFVMLVNYQIPGDPPLTGLAYFAIPGDFHPDCAHSPDLQKSKRLFERFIDIPFDNPAHKITLPNLAKDKNSTIPARWSLANGETNGHEISGNSNEANNSSTINSSSLEKNRQDTGDATQQSTSSESPVEVLGEAKILHSSSSTAAKSPQSAREPQQQQQQSMPAFNIPSVGKDEANQWKAVQPTKAWGADIAWASVGEPGVLDRKAFQNTRFKLVPQMGEAPWVVQMAVSSTPCLLGTKIVQRYFRGEGYLEIDLHIGSSGIANNVVGLCRKYVSAFVCNLGVVIQGESSEELPERVLMCMSMVKMQLRQQVGVTAPHVEYVHAFLREQMNLPMPLISPSAKMLQEENSSS